MNYFQASEGSKINGGKPAPNRQPQTDRYAVTVNAQTCHIGNRIGSPSSVELLETPLLL